MGRMEYRKDEKNKHMGGWGGGSGAGGGGGESSRPTLHLCKVEICIKSHFVVGPSGGAAGSDGLDTTKSRDCLIDSVGKRGCF